MRSPTEVTPMFSSRLTFFFHTPFTDETPSDIFNGVRETGRRGRGLGDAFAGWTVD
jgi:hypothetical protein